MFKKNDYNHEKLTIAVIFSVIAAAFSVAGFFFNNTEEQVLKALNTMEAYKVGWQANREKLKKLYSDPNFATTQGQGIDQALESMGGAAANNNAADNNNGADTTATTSKTLSPEQIASVLDNKPLQGNKDSDIVLVEYTDFECPFCQTHFTNGTVASIISSEKIATTTKQFPLSFHPLAQKSAEGSLCVLELGWEEAFFEYIDKVFTSKDPSVANITAIAKEIGVKDTEFTECLNSNKTAAQVAADMKEGQSLFGVNGTPGNVLINKKTGKYVVVSGAQPLTAFQSAIAQIK